MYIFGSLRGRKQETEGPLNIFFRKDFKKCWRARVKKNSVNRNRKKNKKEEETVKIRA